MKKIVYIKSGKVEDVDNNVAFGLIDRGEAKLFKKKEISEPPKDKMMKRGRGKLRTK